MKSIAIDADSVGGATALRDTLAVGHYKPINSDRYVNDCHEFVFHFTPAGDTASTASPSGCPIRTSPT